VDYFLLSMNRFHWLQATVARGLSTDELIMMSGVQLLIFAVVYAVWGPYASQLSSIGLSKAKFCHGWIACDSCTYIDPLRSFKKSRVICPVPGFQFWLKSESLGLNGALPHDTLNDQTQKKTIVFLFQVTCINHNNP
jgi:hypothetical protein